MSAQIEKGKGTAVRASNSKNNYNFYDKNCETKT